VNGTVLLSGSTLGCVAKYACAPGYDVVGDVKKECLHNSTWSGSNSSFCHGMIIHKSQIMYADSIYKLHSKVITVIIICCLAWVDQKHH
jgi:hypothetical protein